VTCGYEEPQEADEFVAVHLALHGIAGSASAHDIPVTVEPLE
jgi:hypothetical protein